MSDETQQPECDCPACSNGLTPTLMQQEHALIHEVSLLMAYMTAGDDMTARPEFGQMLGLQRLRVREAAAALGGTWTLARALTDSE